MRYALKEWNTTVEALGNGQIVAIWRKGGISDLPSIRTPYESFEVEQKKFVLFPTFTHQNEERIKKDFWFLNSQYPVPKNNTQVSIKYWAAVEEIIQIDKIEILLGLSKGLINSEEYLQASWNQYRNHSGKILILRVYKLGNPIIIMNSPEYSGCKSWIELKIDVPKTNSKAVLSFRDFNAKVRYIKALLELVTPKPAPPPPETPEVQKEQEAKEKHSLVLS